MALTDQDWKSAADALGVDAQTIKAVAQVESSGSGFLPDGQIKILYERHYFHRLTGGKWDNTHPKVSRPTAGGYGKLSEQHAKLQEAVSLDRDAALQSASWGAFQIMGANFKQAGYPSIQAFINDMQTDAGQLRAFVYFIKADPRLVKAIRTRDWTGFARVYNGPNFAAHDYDGRLAAAYTEQRGVA